MGFIEKAVDDLLNRRTFIVSTLFIAVFIAAALFALGFSSEIMSSSLGQTLKEQVKELKEAPTNPLILVFFIFIHNVQVSILISLLYFTFIVPVVIIIFNGLNVGLLLAGAFGSLSFENLGVGPISPGDEALLSYSLLAPHGILEVPTISLVAALIARGFKGGFRGVAGAIARRILVAIVNLIMAAIAETTVTIGVAIIVALLVV